jgi:hypothetical protein
MFIGRHGHATKPARGPCGFRCDNPCEVVTDFRSGQSRGSACRCSTIRPAGRSFHHASIPSRFIKGASGGLSIQPRSLAISRTSRTGRRRRAAACSMVRPASMSKRRAFKSALVQTSFMTTDVGPRFQCLTNRVSLTASASSSTHRLVAHRSVAPAFTARGGAGFLFLRQVILLALRAGRRRAGEILRERAGALPGLVIEESFVIAKARRPRPRPERVRAR